MREAGAHAHGRDSAKMIRVSLRVLMAALAVHPVTPLLSPVRTTLLRRRAPGAQASADSQSTRFRVAQTTSQSTSAEATDPDPDPDPDPTDGVVSLPIFYVTDLPLPHTGKVIHKLAHEIAASTSINPSLT